MIPLPLLIAGGLALAAIFAGDKPKPTPGQSPSPAPPKPPPAPGQSPPARRYDEQGPHRHDYGPAGSPAGTPCRRCGRPKVLLPCHAKPRGKDKAPRAVSVSKPALTEPKGVPVPA